MPNICIYSSFFLTSQPFQFLSEFLSSEHLSYLAHYAVNEHAIIKSVLLSSDVLQDNQFFATFSKNLT